MATNAAPQIRVRPRATYQGHVQRSRVVTQWDTTCNTRDCINGHIGSNLVQESYPFIGLIFERSLTTGVLPLPHVKACWPHITCGFVWSETWAINFKKFSALERENSSWENFSQESKHTKHRDSHQNKLIRKVFKVKRQNCRT